MFLWIIGPVRVVSTDRFGQNCFLGICGVVSVVGTLVNDIFSLLKLKSPESESVSPSVPSPLTLVLTASIRSCRRNPAGIWNYLCFETACSQP